MVAKDTDGPRPTPRSHSTSTKTILSDALELAFETDQDWENFQKKHYTGLTNSQDSLFNSKQTDEAGRRGKRRVKEVLDEILTRVDGNRLEEYQPFVRWAIKHHRKLLTFVGTAQRTPLAAAIDEYHHEFVSLVLQYADKIEDLLGAKINTHNCVQYAIKEQSPFAELMITKLHNELSGVTTTKNGVSEPSKGLKSKENLFLAEAANKMTALHIAAENIQTNPEPPFKFEIWNGRTRRYEVPENSSHGQPPQTLTKATHAGGTDTPRTQPNVKGELERTAQDKEGKTVKDFQDRAPLSQRYEEPVRGSGRPAGQGPAAEQRTVKDPINGKSRPEQFQAVEKGYQFNRLAVVRALIQAEPEALCKKNEKGDTPFQARLQSLAQAKKVDVEDSDEERRKLFDEDEILTYMREYIIESFSRKKAMDALYKEGSAFDLFGLPYSSIDADFLEGLGKVLRFEGFLKYVALPRVAFRDCKGLRCNENKANTDYTNGTIQKPSQDPKDEGKGCQDMCDVFQWLRDCGVSSIMTVKVIDDGEVGHSDEAIENCMNGFGVRSWNWFRVDLPCDVILASAEQVRDVALCSSGNNAVLAGWASPSGLVKLEQLEKVHVLVQKGLERKSRLEKYANDFKKKITDQRPKVKVTYTIQEADVTVDSFFTDRDAKELVESTWMRTMVDFGQFLAQAKAKLNMAPVKIAIIDDGINPTLNIFNDRIRRGESFDQLGENYNGRRGAFYVPSGPHGTLMAQLVCKVCPMVELYIAQLEVFRGQNGQRSFRAESAAEAVTWAVNQGVDIISMSWYIDEDKESQPLNDALILAASKNIIMFCSSIDEGATVTNRTYPGKIESCIKIGASTDTGAKLSWVSSDCLYLLPGDARHGKVGDELKSGSQKAGTDPHNSWSQSTMDIHGNFGSSVSTALAAGLAGTLLFSERLGRNKFPERLHLQNDFHTLGQDKVDHLRDSSHMKDAFKKLSVDKFIHWNNFPKMGMEPWIWDKDSKKYEKDLVKFVNTIVS